MPENVTIVDWWLGNTCNYKCSYCFHESNKGDKRVPYLDLYEHNVDYLLNKIEDINYKSYFILSGGEPTIYPDLDRILYKIRSSKSYVGNLIVTNGSRTLNWWKRNKDLFDSIAISFHIESADKEHILEVCKILKDKRVSVTIMMHNTMFSECMSAYQYFVDNNITEYADLCLKALDDMNNIGNLVEYTEEQNEFIKKNMLISAYKDNSNEYYSVYAVAIDDKKNEYRVLSNKVAHLDPDFSGWECMIGTEHITIDYDGNIRANCNENIFNKRYNLYIGNLELEQFDLRKKPHTCVYGRCRCLGLYEISKKLPLNIS